MRNKTLGIFALALLSIFLISNISATGYWTNLSTTDPSDWVGSDNIYSVVYNPDDNLIYTGIKQGKFGARNFLDRTFGGLTRMKGVGSWEGPNKIIDENVVIVESFSTKKDYLAKDQILRDYVKKKLVSWKQHAISVEYNGKLFIIS
jgi:hypothetical protein